MFALVLCTAISATPDPLPVEIGLGAFVEYAAADCANGVCGAASFSGVSSGTCSNQGAQRRVFRGGLLSRFVGRFRR